MKRRSPFEDKIKVGRKVKILHTEDEGIITDINYSYNQASIYFSSDGGNVVYEFSKFEVMEDE
jgi:hypothetical protein